MTIRAPYFTVQRQISKPWDPAPTNYLVTLLQTVPPVVAPFVGKLFERPPPPPPHPDFLYPNLLTTTLKTPSSPGAAIWVPGPARQASQPEFLPPNLALRQPAANVFTLAVGATTYTETGFAVTPAVGMGVGAGNYVYTGLSVRLDVGLGVGSGSYVVNGFPIGLTFSGHNTYTLAVSAGAYTETGFAITLAVGLPVGAAAYAYTGATVGVGAGIGILSGLYTVTGASPHFGLSRTVGSGVYAVAGFPVGVGAGIGISAGAYAVTGFSARLDVGMGVGAGSYVYTGSNVALAYASSGPHPYVLSIGLGNYVYNGVPVGVVYIPAGGTVPSFGVGGKNVACNYGVSGQGTVFGFSNPVNPFATVVLETDR